MPTSSAIVTSSLFHYICLSLLLSTLPFTISILLDWYKIFHYFSYWSFLLFFSFIHFLLAFLTLSASLLFQLLIVWLIIWLSSLPGASCHYQLSWSRHWFVFFYCWASLIAIVYLLLLRRLLSFISPSLFHWAAWFRQRISLLLMKFRQLERLCFYTHC